MLSIESSKSNVSDRRVQDFDTLMKISTKLLADRRTWSIWRRRLAWILEHRHFDEFGALVIVANVIVIVLDTNANADCDKVSCSGVGLQAMNYVFLSVYLLEVLLRLAVHRLSCLSNPWFVMDAFVVCAGLVDAFVEALSSDAGFGLPDTKVLKLLRMVRFARAIRIVEFVPALRAIVRGFACAMIAMFWGVMTIIAMLLGFSILAVELANPVNRTLEDLPERCQDAFSSVQSSLLMFFQTTVVGDSWGTCVIPLAERNWLFSVFFGVAAVAVQLGLMNLILSAIVQEANVEHFNDVNAMNRELFAQERKYVEELGPLFASMDDNKDGKLSYSEVIAAYDKNAMVQKVFKMLNISRTSLRSLCHLMDTDNSGTIEYDEFLTCMRDAHLQDLRMQMMTVKLQNSDISRNLKVLQDKLRSVRKTLNYVSHEDSGDTTVVNHTVSSSNNLKAASPFTSASTTLTSNTAHSFQIPGLPRYRSNYESTDSAQSLFSSIGSPRGNGPRRSCSDTIELEIARFKFRLEDDLRVLKQSLEERFASLSLTSLAAPPLTATFGVKQPNEQPAGPPQGAGENPPPPFSDNDGFQPVPSIEILDPHLPPSTPRTREDHHLLTPRFSPRLSGGTATEMRNDDSSIREGGYSDIEGEDLSQKQTL